MRAVADQAIMGLEGAGLCIRAMTPPPASVALGDPYLLVRGKDREFVVSKHKRTSDQILEDKATSGVVHVEPNCTSIRSL